LKVEPVLRLKKMGSMILLVVGGALEAAEADAGSAQENATNKRKLERFPILLKRDALWSCNSVATREADCRTCDS
jgi:hypothetical protein